MGQDTSRLSAKDINNSAHLVLNELRDTQQRAGYRDDEICQQLAETYTKKLGGADIGSVAKLGKMLGIRDASTTKEMCDQIVKHYDQKLSLLNFLLTELQQCEDNIAKIKATQDSGKLDVYNLAISLSTPALRHKQNLLTIVDAVLKDKRLKSGDLDKIFDRVIEVVSDTNKKCAAKLQAIQ